MNAAHLALMKKLLCTTGIEATEIYNQICSHPCNCSISFSLESIFNSYYTAVARKFSENQNPQTRKMLEGVIQELEKIV